MIFTPVLNDPWGFVVFLFAVFMVLFMVVVAVELVAMFIEEDGYELPAWIRDFDMERLLMFTLSIALLFQALFCLVSVIGAMG